MTFCRSRVKYLKSNWTVKLQAKLVTLDEFFKQSQMDSNYLEGNDLPTTPSVIGRESTEELSLNLNQNKSSNTEKDIEPELEYNFLNRKIFNLDDLNSIEEIDKIRKIEDHNLLEINSEKLDDGLLWHYRLGHPSIKYLIELQKKNDDLKGIKFNSELIKNCEVCFRAKMKKMPFENNRTRYSNPLQLIHTDIMGPITPKSFPGNNKYIMVIIDDASRYAQTYYLQHKSEAGDGLENFIKHKKYIRL